MTLHICLYGESHLWARRPSPRQYSPHPGTKPRVNSEGISRFSLVRVGGCLCQLSPVRWWDPPRQSFFRPRNPGKGQNKASCPRVLSARSEFCRPAPRGRPPQMLSESSIKRTVHKKDGRKDLEELLKKRRRGGERGEEGHGAAVAAVPWWPGARVCVSVCAFG